MRSRQANGTCASFSFLFKKISDRALLPWRFECVNKFPEPLGENFRAKFPIVGDSGRSNVMPKKPVPTFPELLVH